MYLTSNWYFPNTVQSGCGIQFYWVTTQNHTYLSSTSIELKWFPALGLGGFVLVCVKAKQTNQKKKTLGFYRPEEFMSLWDESRCNWAIRSDRENEGVDWNRSLFAFLAKVYYCHVLLQHCRQHFKLWAKVVFQ